MGVILLELEEPWLRLIRLIPLGNGYRYLKDDMCRDLLRLKHR
jgi:hypothetical protein